MTRDEPSDHRWSGDYKDERVKSKPSDHVIGPNDTGKNMIIKMSKGNIGACTVLMKILQAKGEVDGIVTILHLDDMGIRGEQIWLWYKYVFGENIDPFIEAIWKRKLKVLSYDEAYKIRSERLEREEKDKEALR